MSKEKKEAAKETVVKAKAELSGPKQIGKIDLDKKPKATEEKKVEPKKEEPKKVEKPVVEVAKPKKEEPKKVEPKKEEPKKVEPKVEKKEESTEPRKDEKLKTQYQKLSGPTTTGKKIDLSQFNKPKKKKEEKKSESSNDNNKRKRRRISKGGNDGGGRPNFDNRRGGKGRGSRAKVVKEEPSEEEVQKQVRETLEKLQGNPVKVEVLKTVVKKEIVIESNLRRSYKQKQLKVKH